MTRNPEFSGFQQFFEKGVVGFRALIRRDHSEDREYRCFEDRTIDVLASRDLEDW
jgi:hypothetical protein